MSSAPPPTRRRSLPRKAGAVVVDRVVLPVAARRSWLAANAVVLVLLVLGVMASLALTAGAGEVYESVQDGGGLAGLDQPVLDTARDWRSGTRNEVVTGFTDLGGVIGFPILAAVLIGGAALLLRRWEPIVLAAIALPVALGMSLVGKHIAGRARPPRSAAVPPYESSASFPSGHTILTTALMALLAYLAVRHADRALWRVLAVLGCGAYAVAMGLSRVFLGHHWLTDVAAGWALALGWVVALATLHQAWLLLGNERPAHHHSP